jgi:DNA-binding NtrC family response regulator
LAPALTEAALNYRWPGNLREAENFVKRYLILGDEAQALKELESSRNHGAAGAESQSSPAATSTSDLKSLVRGLKDEAEREAIGKALERTKWNRKEAARLLNISYKALLYKIRRHGLEKVVHILIAALSLWTATKTPAI